MLLSEGNVLQGNAVPAIRKKTFCNFA